MYLQIARVWSNLWHKRGKKRLVLFVSLFLFTLVIFTRSNSVVFLAAGTANEFDHLQVFSTSNFQRILIISPHPDDETLAAGGVIQQVLAAGTEVKVVLVTNGDGQRFAPVMLNKELDPRPKDYIAIGERRQAEVIAALGKLGVQREDIVFLGYPDRGTNALWLADWNTQCPYTASYTRVEKDPYPDTYHAGTAYCGSNLLNDLETIIEEYRPNLIILPHPADQHPDHGAASNFARLAIAVITTRDKSYLPQIWGYLVHYGMFPRPRGKYLNDVLVPPKRLTGENNYWGRVDLSPAQVSLKYYAIEEFSSQNFLLGNFLYSFARRNELFESLPVQVIPPISFTTLPVFIHRTQKDSESSQLGVNNEGFPVEGNLLTGWQTARLNDNMWLDLQMKRDILPDLVGTVHLKLPNGRTDTMDLEPIGSIFSARDFVLQVNLSALGNPSVVAFAVEIKQGGFIVSKTGWHVLVLH